MSADVINYDLQDFECQRLLGEPGAWCEENHFKMGEPRTW